jgi:hypothetical protein
MGLGSGTLLCFYCHGLFNHFTHEGFGMFGRFMYGGRGGWAACGRLGAAKAI